jgi:hypothetical protein
MARRATASGTWPLAVLSAAVVPLFVAVAHAHRAQWSGGGPGYWSEVVVPWAARLWPMLALPPLVGTVAWSGSLPARGWQRALGGVFAGLLPAVVAGLAALPSWIWLARIGAAPVGVILEAYVAGLAALLAGGLAAGLVAAWAPAAAGASVGALLGAAIVGWSWMLTA